jgi:hypothetical protein
MVTHPECLYIEFEFHFAYAFSQVLDLLNDEFTVEAIDLRLDSGSLLPQLLNPIGECANHLIFLQNDNLVFLEDALDASLDLVSLLIVGVDLLNNRSQNFHIAPTDVIELLEELLLLGYKLIVHGLKLFADEVLLAYGPLVG